VPWTSSGPHRPPTWGGIYTSFTPATGRIRNLSRRYGPGSVPALGRVVLGERLSVSYSLLQRTFAIDALACPGCGGRLRLLSAITEPATARKILEHLGLTTHPAPVPRARGPD